MNIANEKGMVLVIVMIFLSIISLLAFNLLEMCLLETKISSYYQNKMLAFYKAEDFLEKYEQEVLAGGEVASAKVIDTSICGMTFYRVTASAEHKGALSKLQSTLVKIGDCNPKPTIKQGKQSFLIVD